jgi:hypothetical protein
MNSSHARLVVVLGMHRSGTSALTRGLELLGVCLGDDLHPPGFDNPKGFWEDRSIIDINERLLNLQSSAHDRMAFAWRDLRGESSLDQLKLEATQLLTRQLEHNNGLWGFKDPRTCRLLTFWQEIFRTIDCEVGFVIALRNPVSVAASLLQRNGIAAEKAYVLWLQHLIPAVLHTNGSKRVVVDFDNLIDAPFSQLARIAASLALPMPQANSPSIAQYENDFLDPRLRHTRFSAAELRLDGRAPAGVSRLYELLTNAANDLDDLESPGLTSELNEIETGLLSVSPVLDYLSRVEDDVLLERAMRSEASHSLSAVQDRAESYRQRSEQGDALLRDAHAQLSLAYGQIDSLNKKLAEIAHELTASAEQYESMLRNAQSQLDFANANVIALDQTLAERDGRIAQLDETVRAGEVQIAAFRQQAELFDALLKQSGSELTAASARIEKLERTMTAADRHVAELLASTSWRITKPLRFMSRLVRRRAFPKRSWTAALLPTPTRTALLPSGSADAEEHAEKTGGAVVRVSAVVPNYNYARYLRQRIESITSQTHPPFEIIVLDDSSTDESVEVIEACLRKTPIAHQLVRNERNSGSVFAQWRRGVELARGEFVWICEADDFAEPDFLERVVRAFEDPRIVLSYSQSRRVDENGTTLAKSYHFYTDDIDERRWRSDYVCTGEEELQTALAIKNTIPNVSAVVFRRANLIRALVSCEGELKRLKIAGDWLVYAELLRTGGIAYTSQVLNSHRHHTRSVTVSSSTNAQHLAEVTELQKRVASMVRVPAKTASMASAYLPKVVHHLGLHTGVGEAMDNRVE